MNNFILKYFASKKRIYTLLIILNFIIILAIFIQSHFTERFSTHHKNITNAIVQIKYLSTQSHLWFEEYLNGDHKEYSKIYINLNKSKEYIEVLLYGGKINNIKYKRQYNDPYIISSLNKSKKIIEEIETIKKQRLLTKLNDEVLDDIYDINFQSLTNTLEELEGYIQIKFTKMYSIYEKVNLLVYITIGLFTFFGLFLIITLNKEIKDKTLQSFTDTLTGIKNRKGYNHEITKQLEFYNKHNIPFSVVIFDIDNFKQINDTYGHKIGDVVLIDISELVSSLIRHNSDGFFRIGGEEFILTLPNTQIDNAKSVAEKIRYNIEEKVSSIKDRTVTISLGVTEVLEDDNEDSIFTRVDSLLYKSKHNGKNMVTLG